MLHIVLYEPEIPPNTGNIIRLCANTGSQLHLIEPLGFELEDKQLRRAGLDYRDLTHVSVYKSLSNFESQIRPKRIWAISTRGENKYTDIEYQAGDALLFGPETRGLPKELMERLGTERIVRLPMSKDSRSLNLSNCVAVLAYEAWRQNDFEGGS